MHDYQWNENIIQNCIICRYKKTNLDSVWQLVVVERENQGEALFEGYSQVHRLKESLLLWKCYHELSSPNEVYPKMKSEKVEFLLLWYLTMMKTVKWEENITTVDFSDNYSVTNSKTTHTINHSKFFIDSIARVCGRYFKKVFAKKMRLIITEIFQVSFDLNHSKSVILFSTRVQSSKEWDLVFQNMKTIIWNLQLFQLANNSWSQIWQFVVVPFDNNLKCKDNNQQRIKRTCSHEYGPLIQQERGQFHIWAQRCLSKCIRLNREIFSLLWSQCEKIFWFVPA